MGRIVVYRYACPYTVDLDEQSRHQLRLAHQLKNELVAIWKRYQEEVAATWRQHPRVADAAQILEETLQSTDIAKSAWEKSKIDSRDRKGNSELKIAWTEAKQSLKKAKADHKAIKEQTYELLSPRFVQLNDSRRKDIKATYATFVQQQGLYWPTYNLILRQHKIAEQAVQKRRKNGEPAEIRFRRWTGEGQIAIQLQQEADDPQRTPEILSSGTNKWRNVVRFPNTSEKQMKAPMAIRIGTSDGKPVWCELPEVFWHRPIPANADIADIKISRRRFASHYKIFVEVTAKLPDSSSLLSNNGICGLNTGWRVLSNQNIRVATWSSKNANRILVPKHLKSAIVIYGECGEIQIPYDWIAKWKRSESIQSRRDKKLEAIRKVVITAWNSIQRPEEFKDVTTTDIKRWQSPTNFVRLTRACYGLQLPIAKALEDWRKIDKLLWEQQTGLRRRYIARRTDLFRVAARLFAENYSLIVTEKPYIAKITRREIEPEHQADVSRRIARLAAPYAFTQSLENAVAAANSKLIRVDPTEISTKHCSCGFTNPSDYAKKSHLVKCTNCNRQYDVDVNAAWNLIARAEAMADTPEPLETVDQGKCSLTTE